jgi:hypothetical protein
MDITRNHYFMIGLVLLFLGIELRLVANFTLTAEFTTFLAKQTNHPVVPLNTVTESLVPEGGNIITPSVIDPPEWIGWLFVSSGSILILHSLAMKKPGG